MFGSNTTLASENNYKEGYNEGVDDVFIAFNEMLNTVKDDNTYQQLKWFYGNLSAKFPHLGEPFEE